jgi:hypothetical protein
MAHPFRVGSPFKRAGKSVAEFCAAYGISRSTFENWARKGVGPAIMQPMPGGRKLITQEAEDQWKRTHTAITTAINAAE